MFVHQSIYNSQESIVIQFIDAATVHRCLIFLRLAAGVRRWIHALYWRNNHFLL